MHHVASTTEYGHKRFFMHCTDIYLLHVLLLLYDFVYNCNRIITSSWKQSN